MTPKKLEPNVVALLLPRLQNEFDASYFYLSASNWCANAGFPVAAAYFKKESDDELMHAKGIQDFLVKWNVIPNLPAIDKPVLKFTDYGDIVEQAYEMEYALYSDYEKTSMAAFKVPDLCVFDFLQKYRTIQTESVAEYADKLNKLEGVDRKNKVNMLLLEELIFEA